MCKICTYTLPCTHTKYTHTLSCGCNICPKTHDIPIPIELPMSTPCQACEDEKLELEALALKYGVYDDEHLEWIMQKLRDEQDEEKKRERENDEAYDADSEGEGRKKSCSRECECGCGKLLSEGGRRNMWFVKDVWLRPVGKGSFGAVAREVAREADLQVAKEGLRGL
ncbi:hypothetical protein P280DRAFT_313915 [Massarina eburnea CBS 473.64]|uniref:Uncharacterized protein n=1 Tax=Massarina eburnea CBS 473.64 TaxID=1395130 RepID=A0A6A6S2Z6_9PLEO|nr:hypothetical protein P280DRAFT_313915 [Massarina eburnea CBS 473.64]